MSNFKGFGPSSINVRNNDIRLVTCPTCGQEKWQYLGGDMPFGPPCSPCIKVIKDRFR